MRKSARILGGEVGLTAQEMNYLLKDQGFLNGEPGEYWPTERGEQYAREQYEHRGPGGYAQYNRDWTVRSWDESIVDELDLSDEAREAARTGYAELSRLRREERASQYAHADQTTPVVIDRVDEDAEGSFVGEILVGGALLLGGIAWHKLRPKVKAWWFEKAKPRIDSTLARFGGNKPETKVGEEVTAALKAGSVCQDAIVCEEGEAE